MPPTAARQVRWKWPTGANHSVGELAGTGTSTSEYASSIACTRDGNPAETGSGTRLAGIGVGANDTVVCTITNKRRGYPRPARRDSYARVTGTCVRLVHRAGSPARAAARHSLPAIHPRRSRTSSPSGRPTQTARARNRSASLGSASIGGRRSGGHVDDRRPQPQRPVRLHRRAPGKSRSCGSPTATAGPRAPKSATTEDRLFPINVPCAATGSSSTGSTCSVSSSFNAIVPGAVVAGKRAIWELGAVDVFDGGPDGVTSTSPNLLFARQGIFVP